MNAPASAPTRPALRYHGGKWRLAPWLLTLMPPHRVYTEPFGGGASVLLRKPRAYGEIYNDLDGEVVNVFRMLRDRGAELQRLLELTPFARAEFRQAYEPCGDDPIEQARRTIARSFMGFGSSATGENSGFRASSSSSRALSTTCRGGAPAPGSDAARMLARAPGESRFCPSVTTISPGCTPDVITDSPRHVRDTCTGRISTRCPTRTSGSCWAAPLRPTRPTAWPAADSSGGSGRRPTRPRWRAAP